MSEKKIFLVYESWWWPAMVAAEVLEGGIWLEKFERKPLQILVRYVFFFFLLLFLLGCVHAFVCECCFCWFFIFIPMCNLHTLDGWTVNIKLNKNGWKKHKKNRKIRKRTLHTYTDLEREEKMEGETVKSNLEKVKKRSNWQNYEKITFRSARFVWVYGRSTLMAVGFFFSCLFACAYLSLFSNLFGNKWKTTENKIPGEVHTKIPKN